MLNIKVQCVNKKKKSCNIYEIFMIADDKWKLMNKIQECEAFYLISFFSIISPNMKICEKKNFFCGGATPSPEYLYGVCPFCIEFLSNVLLYWSFFLIKVKKLYSKRRACFSVIHLHDWNIILTLQLKYDFSGKFELGKNPMKR